MLTISMLTIAPVKSSGLDASNQIAKIAMPPHRTRHKPSIDIPVPAAGISNT